MRRMHETTGMCKDSSQRKQANGVMVRKDMSRMAGRDQALTHGRKPSRHMYSFLNETRDRKGAQAGQGRGSFIKSHPAHF